MAPAHRFFGLGCLLALIGIGASPLVARPFTVADLLRTEGFGKVMVDPGGRWLVFERREAFARMTRFDMPSNMNVLRSRPFVVNLAAPGLATPLIPEDASPGTIIFGFSPNGSRLAIGRIRGDTWRLGVVTMATRGVRWFDLAPGYNPFNRTLEWVSEDRLISIVEADGALPWWLRSDAAPAEVVRGWKATVAGTAAAVTVVGSGRFLNATPMPPRRRIVSLDVRSGDQTLLAVGRWTSIAMSPDARRVAAIEESGIAPPSTDQPVGSGTAIWRHRLSIVDVRSRAIWRFCPHCDVAGTPVWSASGREIALFARPDGESWRAGKVFRVDAVRQSARIAFPANFVPVVLGQPYGPAEVALGWRGNDVLAFGRAGSRRDGRDDWYRRDGSGLEPITRSLVSSAPSLMRTRSCESLMVRDDNRWCLDGSVPWRVLHQATQVLIDTSGRPAQLVGVQRDRGTVRIMRDGGPATSFRIDGEDRIDPATATAPRDIVIVRRSRPDGSEDIAVLSKMGRSVAATVNRELAGVEPAHMVALHRKGADGTGLTDWLYLPTRADTSGGTLPMIVIPYPGDIYDQRPPTDQAIAGGRFHASAQLLAGHGYAVLLPSMPQMALPEGHTFRFNDEITPAVDAAIATGFVDARRFALWGQSYGAYAAVMIATETVRFKAVVATAGIYDLAGVTGTFAPAARVNPEYGLSITAMSGWAETGQGGMGTTPWRNPDRYVANSPIYRAGRIATPILIVTADRDISPLPQAEQLFSALYRQGKDAELLTYWGEGHVISSPSNIEDLYRRAFGWLDRLLSHSMPSGQVISAAPCRPSVMRISPVRTHCSTSSDVIRAE